MRTGVAGLLMTHALAAVLACGAVPVAAQHAGHARDGAAAVRHAGVVPSAFVREMDIGMAKMMTDMHAPGYTSNADVDFLAMMIPHHEGAVEMARLLLIHGADPTTRKLAEDIIATQQVEIEGMRRRLEQLRRGESQDRPDGFPVLGGTRGSGVTK